MSSKKTYVVPDRMHYDIFSVVDKQAPSFICSCAKENEALNIIESLVCAMKDMGADFGYVQYKIRARPTVEHTIHSLRV